MPLGDWEPKGEHVLISEDGQPVKLHIRRVASSNIDWIGWPVSGEPLLIVQFLDGGRYGYLGVTRQKAVAMANAKSTGRYFHANVKTKYKPVKIR
jgi:hypothetical protein